jgi:pimeloyl-ACP methyl ester carboxylesterase
VESPPPIELRCAVDGVGLLSRSWEELRRANPGDTKENQHLQRGELLMTESQTPTVVLVHGGFVDGSGWQGVYEQLKKDGHNVAIVQNPTISLEGDAAATKLILDAQSTPVILVGHSYGGAVITEAGTHPNVAALVYVAAFVPDKGESVNTLIAGFPTDGPQPPILPPRDGVSLPRAGEVPCFIRGRRER